MMSGSAIYRNDDNVGKVPPHRMHDGTREERRSAVGMSGSDVKIKSMWTRKLLSTKNDLSVEVHWLIDDYGANGASVVP